MIHGGCGAIKDPERYRDSLYMIVEAGEKMLKEGSSAVDVVTHCVTLLENDELFNAGKGSVLNADGAVECDASIMDGSSFNAGAIAGVHNIKSPISLARTVMDKSEFVFLIGEGAIDFAEENDIERADDDYFITPARVAQLKQAKDSGKVVLDHSDLKDNKKLGTVGAIALDGDGNLAAATSTGGIVNKKFGRVGDSPVIGAGTFADNDVCAVSCTGYGEQFLKTVLARTAASFVEHEKMGAQDATKATIQYLTEKVDGLGGLIMIDAQGECARAFSTPGMITASVRSGGDIEVLPE